LKKRAKEIGNIIHESKEVHVVSHIDADGITAGSIACKTLERLKKDFSIEFIKQIDEQTLDKIKNQNHELVWFTDLGSSICNNSNSINKVITDHHICSDDTDYTFHLNPHLFGVDGSFEISGAGATYLVSKTIEKKNMDLSPLAIVGACGDLQNKKLGRLSGLNREILDDGKNLGLIDSKLDISYFGRETRPVYKLLQ